MESTMDINLDNQLTTGNEITSEQQPNRNEMDQSLPPSPGISRPKTPLLTIFQRKQQLAQDIKYYTITMENLKSNIKSRRINGLLDESSHIMKEHHQRLANYSSIHQITVSELTSLPNCEIPDFAEHHTPYGTPTKNNDLEFPTLPKTASVKRKDNEVEFVSPPTRKLSKNLRTNPNPDLNFKLNLSNKFNGLENSVPTIDPVEGTSTGTAATKVPVNKNP
ncbi:hypothetical protein TNCV_65091 [Trichonephila clavipes]|nr:hypothetical protein TNCV_65091 [Trichonephila clavipes]